MKAKWLKRVIPRISLIAVLLAIFVFGLLPSVPASADAWWNNSWQFRTKITIDNSSIGETLTNYPVVVELTNINFNFSHAQNAGQDIRFTDSSANPLNYEIESWNSISQLAKIWVKIPSITASSNTEYFWMYSGNSGATDGQTVSSTWNANFNGVWHMNDAQGLTSLNHKVTAPFYLAQGMAYDGTNYYFNSVSLLRKYTYDGTTFTQVATRTITTDISPDDHAGDGKTANGKIYLPCQTSLAFATNGATAAGQPNVILNSVTGLNPNDYVILNDFTTGYEETAQIQSIDGGTKTLTMFSNLLYPYTSSSGCHKQTNGRIYIWNTSDLTPAATAYFDISATTSDTAALAIDAANNIIYLAPYYSASNIIYEFNLTTGAYIGNLTLSLGVPYKQGMDFYNGYLYISSDAYDGTSAYVTPNTLTVWKFDATTGASQGCVAAVHDGANTVECEGVCINGTNLFLNWDVQGESTSYYDKFSLTQSTNQNAAADSTSYHSTAIKMADNSPSQVNGLVDGSQSLNGTSDNVILSMDSGNITHLQFTNDITIQLLLNMANLPSGLGGNKSIIGTTDNGQSLFYRPAPAQIEWKMGASPRPIIAEVNLVSSAWQLVTCTYNQASGKAIIYVTNSKGAFNNESDRAPGSALSYLSMWELQYSTMQAGLYDEIRIGNYTESVDQIAADYLIYTNNYLTLGSEEENPPSVTTNAASLVSMTKDGVTSGSFNGTINSVGGSPTVSGWFEYGLTALYGSTTVVQAGLIAGAFTASIPNNLTPGQTYHYRADEQNSYGTVYGADQTFTYTMPTVTTQTMSGNNFNGNITNMGVATNTYAYFEYGLTNAYGSQTANQTKSAIGAYSASIPNTLTLGQTYHYRSVTMNGATKSYGSDVTFIDQNGTGNPTANNLLQAVLTLLVGVVAIFALVIVFIRIKPNINAVTGLASIAIFSILMFLIIYYFVSAVM